MGEPRVGPRPGGGPLDPGAVWPGELHGVHVATRPPPAVRRAVRLDAAARRLPLAAGTAGGPVTDVPAGRPALLEGWPPGPRALVRRGDVDLVAGAAPGLVDAPMLGGLRRLPRLHAPCWVRLLGPRVPGEGVEDEGERLAAAAWARSARGRLRGEGPVRGRRRQRPAPEGRCKEAAPDFSAGLSAGPARGHARALASSAGEVGPHEPAAVPVPEPAPQDGLKAIGATGAPSSWAMRRATASACWQAIPPCLTGDEPASPTTKTSGRPATRPSTPARTKPCASHGRPGIAGPRCRGSATTRSTATSPSGWRVSVPTTSRARAHPRAGQCPRGRGRRPPPLM